MLMTCFIEDCEYVDGICTKCHLTEEQKIGWRSMSLDQKRSLSNIVKWEKQQKVLKKIKTKLPNYVPVPINET